MTKTMKIFNFLHILVLMAFLGCGGQFITIIPKLNIVVAHKTKLDLLYHLGLKYDVADWQYWELLYDYIATKRE